MHPHLFSPKLVLLTSLYSLFSTSILPVTFSNRVQDDPGRYSMRFEGNNNPNCIPPKTDKGERECFSNFRSFNGYCTNEDPDKLYDGVINSDQFRYFPSSIKPLDERFLRSARDVSEIVSVQDNQNGDIPNKFRLTDFVTFFSQFLDHCIFHTGIDMDEDMPIRVAAHDPIFANFSNGWMPFKRSKRTCRSRKYGTNGGPVNCLPSAIDLSGVYGATVHDVEELREGFDGLMKVEYVKDDEYLPRYDPNTNREMTIPHPRRYRNLKKPPWSYRRRFFAAGDQRANENPALTSLHTIFVREHNRLARLLKRRIPKSLPRRDRDDHMLFEMAKRLNEAQFQSIVAYEFFPTMTRKQLRDIKHDESQSPKISDVFSTAAFRVGHTMVGNEIELRNWRNRVTGKLPIATLFFKEASFLESVGVDDIIRGLVRHRAQEIDPLVVHGLKGHLFVNVEGETANQDLVALNLQRSRDHEMPSYADIRAFFGLGRVRKWSDITKDINLQSRLQSAYRSVDKVEAWVGMMAEDHPNRPMGKTVTRIWEREFTRVLRADRFNFKERKTYDILIKRYMRLEMNSIIRGDRTMRDIILDNTYIEDDELPDDIWVR